MKGKVLQLIKKKLKSMFIAFLFTFIKAFPLRVVWISPSIFISVVSWFGIWIEASWKYYFWKTDSNFNHCNEPQWHQNHQSGFEKFLALEFVAEAKSVMWTIFVRHYFSAANFHKAFTFCKCNHTANYFLQTSFQASVILNSWFL